MGRKDPEGGQVVGKERLRLRSAGCVAFSFSPLSVCWPLGKTKRGMCSSGLTIYNNPRLLLDGEMGGRRKDQVEKKKVRAKIFIHQAAAARTRRLRTRHGRLRSVGWKRVTGPNRRSGMSGPGKGCRCRARVPAWKHEGGRFGGGCGRGGGCCYNHIRTGRVRTEDSGG